MLFNSMVTPPLVVTKPPWVIFQMFVRWRTSQGSCEERETEQSQRYKTNFPLDNISIDFLSMILHPLQQARAIGLQESGEGRGDRRDKNI